MVCGSSAPNHSDDFRVCGRRFDPALPATAEADPNKGGGPLASLKLECKNPDHREQLFDGRRVTTWHRIHEFQMVSCLEIAEGMLLQSPLFEGPDALDLYIPGTLLDQRLVFQDQVVLYVSPNNPGAAEAAHELMLEFEGIAVTTIGPRAPEATLEERSVTAAGALPRTASQQAIEETPGAGVELGSVAGSAAESSPGAGQADTDATHFLVYLRQDTYLRAEGRAFADEIRSARAAGLPIAMIHEKDEARQGCEFSTFFQTSPQDLIGALRNSNRSSRRVRIQLKSFVSIHCAHRRGVV